MFSEIQKFKNSKTLSHRLPCLTAGRLAISFLLFAINLLIPSTVFAQTESELQTEDKPAVVEDVPGLRAEFVQGTQSPWSKEIKFEMKLKSGIDSDRVKITWTLTGPSNFPDTSLTSRSAVIEAGKDYSIPIVVKPVNAGVNELIGKVEAYKADGIYVVTVRKNFATNSAGEVLPLTNEYKSAKTMRLVIIIVGGVVGGIFGIFALFFGFKKFVKWLNKEDVR